MVAEPFSSCFCGRCTLFACIYHLKQGSDCLSGADYNNDFSDDGNDANAPSLEIADTTFQDNRAFPSSAGSAADSSSSPPTAVTPSTDKPSSKAKVPLGGSIHVYTTQDVVLRSLGFKGDMAG